MDEREFHIVVVNADAAKTREVVGLRASLLHNVSPRVFTVRAKRDLAKKLPPLCGVEIIAEGNVPAPIMEILDGQERQWAEAWGKRWNKNMREKERPGQGLSWDHPGYMPPDRHK